MSEKVIAYMLTDESPAKIIETVFSTDRLVHASDVSGELDISVGHAYSLLKSLGSGTCCRRRRLGKWGADLCFVSAKVDGLVVKGLGEHM